MLLNFICGCSDAVPFIASATLGVEAVSRLQGLHTILGWLWQVGKGLLDRARVDHVLVMKL